MLTCKNIALREVNLNFYADQLECDDPKQAWRTINNILGRNNRQHDTMSEIKLDNHLVSSPEDITNQFNEYFTSICPTLAEKNY